MGFATSARTAGATAPVVGEPAAAGLSTCAGAAAPAGRQRPSPPPRYGSHHLARHVRRRAIGRGRRDAHGHGLRRFGEHHRRHRASRRRPAAAGLSTCAGAGRTPEGRPRASPPPSLRRSPLGPTRGRRAIDRGRHDARLHGLRHFGEHDRRHRACRLLTHGCCRVAGHRRDMRRCASATIVTAPVISASLATTTGTTTPSAAGVAVACAVAAWHGRGHAAGQVAAASMVAATTGSVAGVVVPLVAAAGAVTSPKAPVPDASVTAACSGSQLPVAGFAASAAAVAVEAEPRFAAPVASANWAGRPPGAGPAATPSAVTAPFATLAASAARPDRRREHHRAGRARNGVRRLRRHPRGPRQGRGPRPGARQRLWPSAAVAPAFGSAAFAGASASAAFTGDAVAAAMAAPGFAGPRDGQAVAARPFAAPSVAVVPPRLAAAPLAETPLTKVGPASTTTGLTIAAVAAPATWPSAPLPRASAGFAVAVLGFVSGIWPARPGSSRRHRTATPRRPWCPAPPRPPGRLQPRPWRPAPAPGSPPHPPRLPAPWPSRRAAWESAKP